MAPLYLALLLIQRKDEPFKGRWALPGGYVNENESLEHAAQRELYEEAHVRAEQWSVLVDLFTSPGMTNETVRIFLAQGLSDVPPDERHVGVHEEADMPVSRASLADLVRGVLRGDLHNPILVSGVLAAWTVKHGEGFGSLRPGDAPWPAREALPTDPSTRRSTS